MKYLLGIDSGGTVTKASLYDIEGREIAAADELMEVLFPVEGWAERNIEEFKQANFNVIKSVIEKAGVNSADIAGISFTGQGCGLYMFDESGNATYNGILSGDARGKDIVKRWYAEGLVDRVFKPKIAQAVWSGQPVVILAWFSENKPEVLERTRYAVGCKDYLRFLLTGNWNLEMSESSLWGCMDIFKGEFDDELMEAAGILEYKRLFPDLAGSTDICGTVTSEAAELTGLAEGTPVMGGMLDLTACTLGTIALETGKLSLTTGSCSVNQFLDAQPSKEVDVFLTSLYFMPGYYLLSENSYTAASNLEWFIDRFMQQEKEEAKAKGQSIYKVINEMVAGVDTRDCPVFFLPFLYWSNANIDAKGTFIGLSGIHTKAHMLRAIFEGIVFSHHYHLDKLYRIKSKENFDSARISGGGAKSELWVQMFADIIGLPMEVSAVDELGTLGSAICAGIGSGLFDDSKEVAERFITIKKTFYPNEEMAAYYKKKYELYKNIIDSLDGVWSGFSGLTPES